LLLFVLVLLLLYFFSPETGPAQVAQVQAVTEIGTSETQLLDDVQALWSIPPENDPALKLSYR